MEEHVQQALEIVKAQASVRNMTEDEITSMVKKLAQGIQAINDGVELQEQKLNNEPPVDPKKAIREKSIVCLESGKSFKILTKRHLAKFGLTPEEYREKWGYAKKMPLVCKELQRERRKKMKDMKLWEKRAKAREQK
ncbi:MucR family transcriptional regulator [Desulfovibrio inopinatus]|uniref:MucR family transcriptional regulator n=1 Tax=Desulfovibrio inopinatus TaxID=102109 RepID=UPI0004106EF1|nr:MucR family transcriptional regulator [Desulfovibrio inopinatus]